DYCCQSYDSSLSVVLF
nr:immunoglobulin light chain junction region [Macaca mulatta]